MQELRAARGNKCGTCGRPSGDDVKLEFAHVKKTRIKGRSRGSLHRYYDIKKHPEAYLLECWDCHLVRDGRTRRKQS